MSFQVHLLRFRAEVTTPIRLPPAVGAALRGALFEALREEFCLAGRSPACGQPAVAAQCPVCFLLAPVDTEERRGRDVPRPYVLRPSQPTIYHYQAGQILEFSLATFGHALSHFPYALSGIEGMGQRGLGAGRRGGFRLDEVWSENPFAGRQEAVYQRVRGATIRLPALPIQAEHVDAEVARLIQLGAGRRLRITFRSPTRLINARTLVKPETFSFRIFLARLLERQSALWQRYAGTESPLSAENGLSLVAAADAIHVIDCHLQWVELFRASGRHGRSLPMGGLVGHVDVEGDLLPFLSWLVWGSLVHVGKDAAMGNGVFDLEPLPS
jgi:CRISPR-associated endoribonuclease Cas6